MDCRINNESTRTNVRAGRRGPGIALPGTVAPSAANRRPGMGPACTVCTCLLGEILPRRPRLTAAALRRTRAATRPRHPATRRRAASADTRRKHSRLRANRARARRACDDVAHRSGHRCDRRDFAHRQRGRRTRRSFSRADRRYPRARSQASAHPARRPPPADAPRGFPSLLSNSGTGH